MTKAQKSWILCEDPETILWYLQPMEKCIQTKRHKFSFTNYIYLSLGKLCHGYSHGRASGQKPRLPKEGKTIVCKTDNFVPLVVPGLSTSSRSNSSSTSALQDLPTSPAQERSGDLAPRDWCRSPPKKTQNKNEKRDGNRDSDDRLRDLLEWLEEFTDDPEDTEVLVPAHCSQNSVSERPTEVATKSRKHSIETHFPKHPNCAVCLRKKMTTAPYRRRTGETPLQADKFGDLITADHKVLNEVGESRNNHRYAFVVQDLATQWIQSYPCKSKLSKETEKSLQKFFELSQKSIVFFTLTIHWNFGKSCAYYLGIIVRQHLTVRKQNGIAERGLCRIQEGLLLYCCNQVWMKNGGRIPWSATAICEMSKTSWQKGKLRTKDDL